jgi:glycosyltransferase involved in cell wall biosynthesis
VWREGEHPEGWRALAARTAAVIPVLNEEALIGEVVSCLLNHGVGWVIVVDNGSKDRSADVAARAGAVVVHEEVRGYGQACWTGMQHLPDRCELVVFVAGDAQDSISELPRLLEVRAGPSSRNECVHRETT